jgi:hypothetical protein
MSFTLNSSSGKNLFIIYNLLADFELQEKYKSLKKGMDAKIHRNLFYH